MLSTTIRTHAGIILSIICVGVNGAYQWQVVQTGELFDVIDPWYADEATRIHGATCHLIATAGIEILEDTDGLLHAALMLDAQMAG